MQHFIKTCCYTAFHALVISKALYFHPRSNTPGLGHYLNLIPWRPIPRLYIRRQHCVPACYTLLIKTLLCMPPRHYHIDNMGMVISLPDFFHTVVVVFYIQVVPPSDKHFGFVFIDLDEARSSHIYIWPSFWSKPEDLYKKIKYSTLTKYALS